VLNKSGLMRLQWKMDEFKAKIARHSAAIAQIFNVGIVHFICSIANHDLFSISLGEESHNDASLAKISHGTQKRRTHVRL